MADDFGCTLSELCSRLSSRELTLRVVRRAMKDGYTFNREKIEEIKVQQERQKVEAFLNRARAHWKNQGI